MRPLGAVELTADVDQARLVDLLDEHDGDSELTRAVDDLNHPAAPLCPTFHVRRNAPAGTRAALLRVDRDHHRLSHDQLHLECRLLSGEDRGHNHTPRRGRRVSAAA